MTYTIFARLKEKALQTIDQGKKYEFPELFRFFQVHSRRRLDSGGNLFVFVKPRRDRKKEKQLYAELEVLANQGLLVCISDTGEETEKPLNEKVSDTLLYYVEDVLVPAVKR